MSIVDATIESSWRHGGPAAYGSYAIEKRLQTLFKYVCMSGQRVLDLGCGNGCYTIEMARRAKSVIGVDADLSNLTSFQSQIPRILATGEKLPFPSSAFDIVTMIEVLEHTIDDRTVLAECNRILNVDGYLALFVPNKLYPMESHPCHIAKHSIGRNIPLVSWLPSSIRKHLCFAKIYSKRQLLAMARESGFLVEKLSYVYPPVDSFPLPQTFKNLYRTLAWRLEESPLQIFGVSIFALLRKTSLLNVKSTLKAHRTSEHSR